jgi:hypothetical protein
VIVAIRPDEFGTHEAEIEELYAIHKNRAALASLILEQVCRDVFGLGARGLFVAVAPSDVTRRCYFGLHGFGPDRPGYLMRLLP